MKKKTIFIIVGVIAIALTLFYKYHLQSRAPEPDSIWVSAQTVKTVDLPLTAHAIGTIVARSVEITPELAGQVKKVLFQDGTFVQQDTPLIQLDDAIYQAKYSSDKASLIYSQSNYRRMVLLGKQGAIAKQAIDQAEADLKEKQAAAEESEVTLEKMLLKAPFAGVVGKAKVNPGDYVTIGQSVVTLTETKHLRVEYNVPEKYLPLLKLGQEVKITTTAYPGKVFIGKLAFISPTINTDSRSISLYAEITNDSNQLAAGMFVEVIQSLGIAEHVLMIPARSLVPILDGEEVYKIVNGKAFAASIVIGKRTEESVEVISGLSLGDVIITDGQLKVKNGVPVKIKQ